LPGTAIDLSVSLNGQETSEDMVGGKLSILVGPEPKVLEVIPRYAYVGDFNIVLRIKAENILDTDDLSCRVGPLKL
jgi:hypothetical protein